MPDRVLPQGLQVDPVTGVMQGATRRYEKRLSELTGAFVDEAAFRGAVETGPDRLAYEVYEFARSFEGGDVIFGTSVLQPGRIGREFLMTRGHAHQRGDRTELYYGLSGRGVLLLQPNDGVAEAIEVGPGTAVHVPPYTRHRSINVGEGPFITLFCYPADSGQDYEVIECAGGMALLVIDDGSGGWKTEPNPRFARNVEAKP